MTIAIHPMSDADFAWLLGEGQGADGLILVAGGIAPAEVITMLRGITAALTAGDARPLAWLVSEDGVAVGMISFTRRGADGRYELGYGMAAAYHGQGGMTRALGLLVATAAAHGHDGLTAETSVDNPASQRVLVKNGFLRTGTRDDPEDGALFTWAIDLNEKAEL